VYQFGSLFIQDSFLLGSFYSTLSFTMGDLRCSPPLRSAARPTIHSVSFMALPQVIGLFLNRLRPPSFSVFFWDGLCSPFDLSSVFSLVSFSKQVSCPSLISSFWSPSFPGHQKPIRDVFSSHCVFGTFQLGLWVFSLCFTRTSRGDSFSVVNLRHGSPVARNVLPFLFPYKRVVLAWKNWPPYNPVAMVGPPLSLTGYRPTVPTSKPPIRGRYFSPFPSPRQVLWHPAYDRLISVSCCGHP